MCRLESTSEAEISLFELLYGEVEGRLEGSRKGVKSRVTDRAGSLMVSTGDCGAEVANEAFPHVLEQKNGEGFRNMGRKMQLCREKTMTRWSLSPSDAVLSPMIVVPKVGGGKSKVCLVIQTRDFQNADEAVDAFEWHDFLSALSKPLNTHYEVVHLRFTSNQTAAFHARSFTVQSPDGKEVIQCHEALLTPDDIRVWCPTVAYSGCDARELAKLNGHH